MEGLDKVKRNADESGGEELPWVKVAELDGIVEDLVADTCKKGLGDAVGHIADISRKLQLPKEAPNDGQQQGGEGYCEDGGGSKLCMIGLTLLRESHEMVTLAKVLRGVILLEQSPTRVGIALRTFKG